MPWDSFRRRDHKRDQSCVLLDNSVPGEKRLGDSGPSSGGEAFKYLDMWQSLKDLIPSIKMSCSNECEKRIEFRDSSYHRQVRGPQPWHIPRSRKFHKKRCSKDTGPWRGGAPTRYVMNYLKYSEYKVTLEQIFQQHVKLVSTSAKLKPTLEVEIESESPPCNSETVAATTPFSIQLVTIMDLWTRILKQKSNLYKEVIRVAGHFPNEQRQESECLGCGVTSLESELGLLDISIGGSCSL
ncbi:hypothetical protein HAX54_004228 [Datura stramonium]|uniref:Exocyst subunit Exo70 family protein n=1 Tax=Datura stramonium TaxID=4076 RepID=A0ABS8WVD0_DATST|nr:hypothetical protein [Datura stramonium]